MTSKPVSRVRQLWWHTKAHANVFILIELALLSAALYIGVVGGKLAVSALRENTKSNLAAGRSQLYEAENIIASREFDGANSKLLSIYAHPAVSVADPKEYCLQRLRVIADDPLVLGAVNVEQLYDAFQGLGSFGSSEPSRGVIEMRRVFTHMTTILIQMHGAFDYHQASVLSQEELDTWLGYTTDIGPHPMFLTLLSNWHQARYMSRPFAKTVRDMLLKDSPRNRAIIEYFYPEMLTPAFLEHLPDY